MEKGKKGSTIIEGLRHLGDYARRVGVAALVACGAIAPSAACSLEGDPVDHQITAYLYCEDGDGNPNTNPVPEVLEVRDIDGGNRQAGGNLYPDLMTFTCPKKTSAGIRNVFQKYGDKGGGNGDYRYNISIHCDGDVKNPINYYRVGKLDDSDEDKGMIQIATNGFCDIVNVEGPNPVNIEGSN